jgi:hypothetical protein
LIVPFGGRTLGGNTTAERSVGTDLTERRPERGRPMTLSNTIVPLHSEPATERDGLRDSRLALGLSISAAARVSGVSRARVRQLEADPHFTPAALRLALTYVALSVLSGIPLETA